MSPEQPHAVAPDPSTQRRRTPGGRGLIVRAGAVALTLAALVALPASVQAVRPGDAEELYEILGHLDGPVWIGCYAVSVSTVDSRWARSGPAEPITADCAGVPREIQLHTQSRGRWTVAGTVEDPSRRCSEAEEDIAYGHGLTTAVGVDLGVCTAWPPVPASRTTLSCWKNDSEIRNVRRPKSCYLPGQTISGSYLLSKIRWKNWGSRVATATALQSANHGRNVNGRIVFDKRRVKLRASRPVESDGERWYQRVTVNGRKAAGVTVPWADSPFE